jgi:urease accessory protein UreE
MVGKKSPTNKAEQIARVQSVPLSDVQRSRHGKHFVLMQEVLAGLATLPTQSALKVPLGVYSAKDLRSAVIRAASSRQIEIESRSDEKNLYVWKKHN